MPRSHQTPTAAENALETLYGTFNRYQGTHLEGCPHCVSFEESAALRRAPLRKLGGELQRYLFKAMTTWGTVDDFKYFVPRLLELYASGTDAWLLRDKLAYANWRAWPEPERRAVEDYLQAEWREQIAAYGSPLPGHELLETLLALEIDMTPYDPRGQLDLWRADPSRESARQMSQFVLEYATAVVWSHAATERPKWWQMRYEISEQVQAWLLEPATRERLEMSFMEYGDVEFARAFDLLEMLARYA